MSGKILHQVGKTSKIQSNTDMKGTHMASRMPRRPRQTTVERVEKLKAIYAESRRSFTASDLQRFTEIEEGIPFECVIKDCEEMHRRHERNKK